MSLARYVATRIAALLLTVLVGSVAVFLVMKAAPGDPAVAALGENARPELVAAFRAKHNLDVPWAVQYGRWLAAAARGDFGLSLTVAADRPIASLIAARLPNTIFVGALALVLAVALSLFAGTIAALHRGRAADTVATSLAALGISMPDFWLSYVLILVLALGLGLFPAYGFTAPSQSLVGALHSGFLPALAVAAPLAAVFSRTLRTALLESSHRDYVVAARSFGFHPAFVFVHWIFRNALIPYITIIGLQIRYILGGVVVIERIFGIAGIGSLMVDGAFARDYPVVQACAVVFLVLVLSVNLLVDVACSLLDPRRSR
ncbi:MAG: ABC transporter permease [Alphaproteobacteria bacterium]|nr:ABC transporter permease [Alphaproteobacteria bacterium]